MKGYFSKIVKQSGIRFSPQGAGGRVAAADETVRSFLPLDREETVMVSPLTKGKTAEVVRPAELSEIRLDERQIQPPGQEMQAARRSRAAEIATEMDTERRPRPEKTTSSDTAETSLFAPPENHVIDDARPETSADFQPLEQIISKETALPYPGTEVGGEDQVPRSETVTVSGSKAAEQAKTKGPFAETAKAIDDGEASPREVHAKLFREVQQWAADQPGSAGAASFETETEEPASPIPEMAPVRRIGRSKQTESFVEKNFAPNDHQPVPEQNFELSIGTISVVIEDDQRPERLESLPHRQDPQPTTAEPSRFSRLRRSYI